MVGIVIKLVQPPDAIAAKTWPVLPEHFSSGQWNMWSMVYEPLMSRGSLLISLGDLDVTTGDKDSDNTRSNRLQFIEDTAIMTDALKYSR